MRIDREQEAGVATVLAGGALIIGTLLSIGAYVRKKSGSVSNDGNYDYGENNIPLQHGYEVSDDGYFITSWVNGSARGWRNHNPLNIVKTSDNWIGKITPNTDGKFEQFISNIYGYRAACVLLRNYISKGYNTISKIVDRWSGKSNNTAYINYVVKETGIPADQVIGRDDWNEITDIMYAMNLFECGTNPKPDWDELIDGCLLVRYGYDRPVSGIGAVNKRRIYREIEAAQRSGIQLDGAYDDRDSAKLEKLGKRFGFKQSSRSTKGYGEAYFGSLKRAYNAIAGIGSTNLPYTESSVRNSNGDVILTHRDYGTPAQQLNDAISWLEDQIQGNHYGGQFGAAIYIARGGKLLWNGTGSKRGVREMVFASRTNADGERKQRISYLASEAKGGISPDRLAHMIWESCDGQGDSQEILDGVLDFIRYCTSKKAAQEDIMQLYMDAHRVDNSGNDLPF